MTDLTAVSVDDVVAEARRRVRNRRGALIDSGLDDEGTRDLIRTLNDVRIGAATNGREIRARLPRRVFGRTRAVDVVADAVDVDLAALGMPSRVANTAEVVKVDDDTWGLRWNPTI